LLKHKTLISKLT